MYQWSVYSFAYALAAVVALVAAALAWRQRALPAARWAAMALFAMAWWATAIVFESATTTLDGKLLWSQIAYIGTTTVPLCYMLMAAAYTRRTRWLQPHIIALLALPPLATTLIAFTNSSHGWLWREIVIQEETNLATYAKGPWFVFSVVHAYAYLIMGASFFLRHMDQAGGTNRRQVFALLLSPALPVLSNLLYLSEANPIPGLDWTVPAFVAAGVIMVWALLRLRLLEILPIARTLVIELMDTAVLVLDERGRIIDANPAMSRLVNVPPNELLGQDATAILTGAPVLTEWILQGTTGVTDTTLETGHGPRRLDIQVAAIPTGAGSSEARLIVLHDRTELERAQEKIETLERLLPICASCKRIRDDQGHWLAVEAYLGRHRGIAFTHGLCPDCIEKLYPDEKEGNTL